MPYYEYVLGDSGNEKLPFNARNLGVGGVFFRELQFFGIMALTSYSRSRTYYFHKDA